MFFSQSIGPFIQTVHLHYQVVNLIKQSVLYLRNMCTRNSTMSGVSWDQKVTQSSQFATNKPIPKSPQIDLRKPHKLMHNDPVLETEWLALDVVHHKHILHVSVIVSCGHIVLSCGHFITCSYYARQKASNYGFSAWFKKLGYKVCCIYHPVNNSPSRWNLTTSSQPLKYSTSHW